jgi:hypothetical protein
LKILVSLAPGDAGEPYTLFSPAGPRGAHGWAREDQYGDIAPNGDELRRLLDRQRLGHEAIALDVQWDSGGRPQVQLWVYRNVLWYMVSKSWIIPYLEDCVDRIFYDFGNAFPSTWYCFEEGSRPPAVIQEAERKTRRALRVAVRQQVWLRDNGRCVSCASQEQLEFDHIIPWADGGSDEAANLQLLCLPCNRRKGRQVG